LIGDRVGAVVEDGDGIGAGRFLDDAGNVGMAQEIERELDVVGGDRYAIVPAHIGPQVHGPGPEVRRVLPAPCEPALQLALLVRGHQREEDEEPRHITADRTLVVWKKDCNGGWGRSAVVLGPSAPHRSEGQETRAGKNRPV
jgi:hypothetical protein